MKEKKNKDDVEFQCPLNRQALKHLRKGDDYTLYFNNIFEHGDKWILVIGKKTNRGDYLELNRTGWGLLFIDINDKRIKEIMYKSEGIKLVKGKYKIHLYRGRI